MDYGTVSNSAFVYLGTGAVIFLVVPIVISIIWKNDKAEPVIETKEETEDQIRRIVLRIFPDRSDTVLRLSGH